MSEIPIGHGVVLLALTVTSELGTAVASMMTLHVGNASEFSAWSHFPCPIWMILHPKINPRFDRPSHVFPCCTYITE